jgi:melibiase-like protein/beta-galactosidase-like protein
VVGRLRFELDDRRRWSVWYRGDGPPVPLIEAATLTVHVGDRVIAVNDLEDITIGGRRPPGGDSILIRGRAAGMVLEVELFAAEEAAAPTGAVTVTLYPDRALPVVRGVTFFDVPDALPGNGPLTALVNGYHSWDACRVEPLRADMPDAVSHGALGLTRAGQGGLAVAFDAGEPGEAKVRLSGQGLAAVSDWLPARALRTTGDASTMRLCYDPAGDGLSALAAVFQPSSPVDRERLAAVVTPAGWCSWYELYGKVTEDDVVANLELCAATFNRRDFRLIQLDDGYQKATGDWDTNAKFPHGHRWLTDRIHAKGYQAGLWIAPFAVTDRSGIPAAHPGWLLQQEEGKGPIVWDTREDWGGRVYSIDGAHPEVRQWLHDLARRVVSEWGYDYLKIDFLHWAAAGVAHAGGLTHAEAYRRGLEAIRDGLGPEAFLLGCGAPLQHAVGCVNGMRIGTDVDASWGGLEGPARAAAMRGFYHRAAWLNDPDCLVVRPPLSLEEARAWTSVVAVSGGLALFSDNLPKLPAERLDLLRRTLPVAPAVGRAVDVFTAAPEIAPAIAAGADVYPIPGPWKFRTGDDPGYAARGYDEQAWETAPVPGNWETVGHPDYDGFAWYRTRFTLPSSTPPSPAGRTVYLELGKIDDADETFINGTKVGSTGELPPNYRGEWQTYRRYPVPADALNWGGENVLAVRAYDGGGPGGFWSVRRERPPATWIVEGAPRWWTAVLVNWDDDARDVAVPLTALGITGNRFAAYDVWRDAPLADLTTTLTVRLEPRGALTVAIRPALARPQVIGSTRHVVQGAVDITEETWEAATRTLRASSVRRDGRAYAVTIAVPKGMRAGACTSDVPCKVRSLATGQVVLEWEPGDGRDIHWALKFRQTTRR